MTTTDLTARLDAASTPAGIAQSVKDAPAGLRDGLVAYYDRIAGLGGYGARVSAVMPDGAVRCGTLGEAGCGGCQPQVTTDGGRRYRIQDLASVTAL